jgi:Flp pilus assembly protein TadD
MTSPGRRSRAVFAWPLFAVILGGCTTDMSGTALDATLSTATSTSAAPEPSKPLDVIKDDLGHGKEHYRKGNYGLAEMYFRRAVESAKGDPEAWLGLAAAYDQLKRFELADRAYSQALKLTGPTPEFLNNRGYSYLLRGDTGRAAKDLAEAAAKAPGNERIENNLKLLDQRLRRRV